MGGYVVITIVVITVLFLISAVKVLNEYERAVVFRLGRVLGDPKGPGLIIIIPLVDRFIRISLRTIVQDVPPQDVITKDNVTVKVNAVIYFRVINPLKAIIEVENYLYATSQLSQTTLRSVCGQAELDELLSKREEVSAHIQSILDRQTDPWGIKVSAVELKHIDLPEEMQRAMAKQAEAERERRAKVINSEGEFQAAQKLYEAAVVIAQEPIAVQLRFLQTIREISSEGSTNTIIPLPIDLLAPSSRNSRTGGDHGSHNQQAQPPVQGPAEHEKGQGCHADGGQASRGRCAVPRLRAEIHRRDGRVHRWLPPRRQAAGCPF